MNYRGGTHFVWCSEYYDPKLAPPGSAAAAIAPSSSPKSIYDKLHEDWAGEDVHSALIRGYRKTFKQLAKVWFADGSITELQRDEIVAKVTSQSWKIWRPVLFVIPKEPIVAQNRLIVVPHKSRAGYGPELQIIDLQPHEFDVIER
jgi:hypothetical protein